MSASCEGPTRRRRSCASRATSCSECVGCDSTQVLPERSEFLVLDLGVAMSERIGDYAEQSDDAMPMPLDAASFMVLDSGDQHFGARSPAWTCFADEALLAPFVGPGEVYSDRLVFDAGTTAMGSSACRQVRRAGSGPRCQARLRGCRRRVTSPSTRAGAPRQRGHYGESRGSRMRPSTTWWARSVSPRMGEPSAIHVSSSEYR